MGKSTGPTTHRSTYTRPRKDTTMKRIILVTSLGVGAVVLAACTAGAITSAAQHAVDTMPALVDHRITPTPTPTVDLPVDEWNGVPECTDAIADAGGICHGEPITVVTTDYAAPAPSAEDTPETWVAGTPATQVFEDGSWLAADGTQGCTPGAACDQLPPVPAGEPTTPNGGYFPTLELRPCQVEDDDNCYWDAARMGNGQGTSFITVDGITYYPEVTE